MEETEKTIYRQGNISVTMERVSAIENHWERNLLAHVNLCVSPLKAFLRCLT